MTLGQQGASVDPMRGPAPGAGPLSSKALARRGAVSSRPIPHSPQCPTPTGLGFLGMHLSADGAS